MRSETSALRTRLKQLANPQTTSELRRLQYDAVASLVDAQRKLVALHGELLALLRADREQYRQQRVESIELALACDALRELIREIERALSRHG